MEVSGLRLHVRESGEGRPLLLINGIGAHIDMWASLDHAVPQSRVIAFDAPGTGRSGSSWVPIGLAALALLTEKLLDRLGHDRVDVLGYSFGGLVAQFLARQAPHRVRRLVLAGTTPGWGGVPGSPWTLAQMATPLRYYWRPYYEMVIGDLMGGRARRDREFVRRHGDVRRLNPPTPFGYFSQVLALAASPGSLKWLSEVTAPTLVVSGDDDPVMPLPNAYLLGRYLPNARVVVLPGEGHLLLMDDRSAALPVISDFLSAPGLARSSAWRDAIEVDDEMLRGVIDSDPAGFVNPAALLSACVRSFSRPPHAEAASR